MRAWLLDSGHRSVACTCCHLSDVFLLRRCIKHCMEQLCTSMQSSGRLTTTALPYRAGCPTPLHAARLAQRHSQALLGEKHVALHGVPCPGRGDCGCFGLCCIYLEQLVCVLAVVASASTHSYDASPSAGLCGHCTGLHRAPCFGHCSWLVTTGMHGWAVVSHLT